MHSYTPSLMKKRFRWGIRREEWRKVVVKDDHFNHIEKRNKVRSAIKSNYSIHHPRLWRLQSVPCWLFTFPEMFFCWYPIGNLFLLLQGDCCSQGEWGGWNQMVPGLKSFREKFHLVPCWEAHRCFWLLLSFIVSFNSLRVWNKPLFWEPESTEIIYLLVAIGNTGLKS